MGAVFEALDRERERHVALKVLTVENPDALLRFKREFRALQSVHHPNLVSLGEPEYMAPEQAMGHELTAAADWYAVGALLYEALVGEPPFSGPAVSVMVQKQMQDPPRPSAEARNVPEDLDALCMALLRRDPA